MRILPALVLSTALTSCAQPQPAPDPPPFKPAASVLELMEGPVAHAAEVYWNSVGTTVDDTGVHERFPKDDEEWEAVWASAITIAEAGNLLMMAPRAKDNGEWMKFSGAMIDAGMNAAKAALAKDRSQVMDAGGTVYDSCLGCHQKYVPGTQTPVP
jgi:hypothetical protein